jgi:hypothetical protein
MMGKSERQASDGEERERQAKALKKSERQASDREERERQRDRQVIEKSERDRRASDGEEQQETGE